MIAGDPEPLSTLHDLHGFDSGVPILDDWLRLRAPANQIHGASRTFVCVGRTGEVAAFYSLAAGSIGVTHAVGRFRRNMPDPIPAIVLARMAVDRRWQGMGLGRAMIGDAALRVEAASRRVGIRGLMVQAISDEAQAFYEAVGFRSSPDHPRTLMVTLADLQRYS